MNVPKGEDTMAEQQNRQTPDVAQLWRDWLTQSERQVNTLFSEALNQEVSARSVAGFMEMYATLQRLLAEGMQRYLAFVNMPSRNDVVGLGETLRSIEDRLARIEETLQIAAAAVDGRERSASLHEPARTRQAPVFPDDPEGIPSFNRGNSSAIPEELRR
jgi:hypothetical protein